MKRKLIACLLSLSLLCGLMPSFTLATFAEEDIDSPGGAAEELYYTITFVVGDQEYYVDTKAGEVPQVPADVNLELTGYEFTGWTPELTAATEAATYTVQFNALPMPIDTPPEDTPSPVANTYKITFEYGVNDTKSITIDVNAGETPIPPTDQMVGYTITSWSPEITAASADATYKAACSSVEYTITYKPADIDWNNKDNYHPETYTIETDTFTLGTPKKNQGKDFVGWTGTGLNGYTETVTIQKGSTGSRTYTANWETAQGNQVDVLYSKGNVIDPDEVQNFPENTIVNKNGTVTPIVPTHEGYDFIGWKDGNGDLYTSDATITVTDTITLTAQWQVKSFTLNYNLTGLENVQGISRSVSYGEAVDLSSLVSNLTIPEGYTLSWASEDVTITEGKFQMPAKDVTVTGMFTENSTEPPVDPEPPETYTVTYLPDAEGVTGLPEAQTKKENENLTLSEAKPTRTGYTFTGWLGSNGVTYQPGDIYSENVTLTLTAQWTQKSTYTISYDLAGGTVVGENPTTYTEESADITLINPTREGYTFAGWTGTGLNAATETVIIPSGSTGDRSYTATWTADGYSISYDLVGGSLAEGVTNPTGYSADADAITLNNPSKEGFNFAGWTGTDLTEPTVSVTIPTGSIGDRTYTATWTPEEYTICYNLDGGQLGEDISNPATYTIESDAITLPTPTRAGYTFKGWTSEGLIDPAVTVTIPAGSTGDRVYTANWEEIKVTITYVAVGGEDFGTVDEPETIGADTGIPQGSKAEAARQYRFVGWYTDENCEVPVDAGWVDEATHKLVPQKNAEGILETATYYAKFERSEVDLTIDLSGGKSSSTYLLTLEGTSTDGDSVVLKLAVPGGETITVRDLPVGSYTITPDNSWNWRQTVSVEVNGDLTTENATAVVSVSGNGRNQWFNDYDYAHY